MLPTSVVILSIRAIRKSFSVKFGGKNVAQPPYTPKHDENRPAVVDNLFEFN